MLWCVSQRSPSQNWTSYIKGEAGRHLPGKQQRIFFPTVVGQLVCCTHTPWAQVSTSVWWVVEHQCCLREWQLTGEDVTLQSKSPLPLLFYLFLFKALKSFYIATGGEGKRSWRDTRAISSSLRTGGALTNMVKHHSPWPEGEKLFCSEKLSTCAWWAESLVSSSLSKDEGETGAEVYFLSCMKSLRIRHARKTDHAGCVPPSPYYQASTKRRYSKGRSQCQVEQSGWQFVTKLNVDIAPKTSGYDSKFSCV